MTMFWAALVGALAALLLTGSVLWMAATVRRHNRKIAELRKVADVYWMPSPWWKRWYQPDEHWDRRWS